MCIHLQAIADSVLRNMLLMTHRQAWTWQDEYCQLTIADVRRLEAETQQYLLTKMKGSQEAFAVSEGLASATGVVAMSASRRASALHIERLEIEAGAIEAAAAMRRLDSEGSLKSCVSSYFEIGSKIFLFYL